MEIHQVPKKSGRGQARFLLWGVFCLPLISLVLAVVMDPYQLFHSQPLKTPVHFDALGDIRRHFFWLRDKETAIVGSCMAIDMLDEEVENLGGFKRALNVSMLGDIPYHYLDFLFSKNSSIKTVIMGFDPHLLLEWGSEGNYQTPLPEYPPRMIASHLRTLLSLGAQQDALIAAFHALPLIPPSSRSSSRCLTRTCVAYGRRFYGARSYGALSLGDGKAESLKEVATFVKTHSLEEIETRFKIRPCNMINQLLARAIQRPDMTFIFFVPPFTIIRTASVLSSYICGILYILDRIEALPNVSLYAFDDVKAITGNFANYMDEIHQYIGVHRYMLRSMKVGKHRLTKENVLAYLRGLIEVIETFNPTPDWEHTVGFEGPYNAETEKAFARWPCPTGPDPLMP
ncbi:MAG: hypothetical protein LBD66_00265 [Holosporales bacterium]|nr:hypothetical protein [Holosporales bacterium]